MVSIVVTFYNNEKYVGACLESIINQTYSDIEVIIIDDGSEDNSAEICRRYLQRYKNIQYYYVDHCGVSVARNTGISHAKGEYIMFVDGDDELSDNMIEELLEHADDEADITCCSCTAFRDGSENYVCHFFDSSRQFITNSEKEQLFMQLFDSGYGQKENIYTAIGVPWGKLYRSDFLKQKNLLFKPGLLRMQDNIFNMHAFYEAKKIIYYDKPLYRYRLNNILSYNKGYPAEIYMEIAGEREKFWSNKFDDFSGGIKKMYLNANLSSCLMALKNTALSNKLKDSVKKMAWICEQDIFKKVIYNDDVYTADKKQESALCLIRKKRYRVIHLMLKLKQKINR